jgi:hypothetical protein
VHGVPEHPPDDLPGEEVDDHREVKPALGGGDIRYVVSVRYGPSTARRDRCERPE